MLHSSRRPHLIALGILALCSLRLIHLEADTPLSVGTGSMGVYVDEGYKTLSPRNLLLYGNTHWNPHDDYPGWMGNSPATQWSYYFAFRLFGPRLGSARVVSILWFFILLVGYACATAGDYPRGLFFFGLALLGLLPTLFFFSRIAIFEAAIMACLYSPLFLLRTLETARPYSIVAATSPFLLFSTLAIKPSCLVYFFPVVVGLFVAWGIKANWPKVEVALSLFLLAVAGMSLLYVRSDLLYRIEISPQRILKLFFLNPLMHSSALLMAAGLLCAFHAMLTDPQRFLGKSYRAALLTMVIGGPVLFGLSDYTPLRYFVPLLPAYLFLTLEWLHLRAWEWPLPGQMSWQRIGVCVLFLSSAMVCLLQAVNKSILIPFTLRIGEDPGLEDKSIFFYAVPFALIVAWVGLWKFRQALFSRTFLLRSISVLLLLSTLRTIYADCSFLLFPSYRSREISAAVQQIVPSGRSIAGDWAPFFALGTEIRALYSSTAFNNHLVTLRPDYFLFSDTAESMPLGSIEAQDGVELGPPVFVSSYAGHEVVLYPLKYVLVF